MSATKSTSLRIDKRVNACGKLVQLERLCSLVNGLRRFRSQGPKVTRDQEANRNERGKKKQSAALHGSS